jgi:hypothetical protein
LEASNGEGRTLSDPRDVIAMQMLVFDFPGMTSQQYDQLCRSLNDGQPLRTLAEFHRAGYRIISHFAGPTPDGWRVVDVWESEEALGRFRQKLLPLLEHAGIPQVTAQVYPAHNVVTR